MKNKIHKTLLFLSIMLLVWLIVSWPLYHLIYEILPHARGEIVGCYIQIDGVSLPVCKGIPLAGLYNYLLALPVLGVIYSMAILTAPISLFTSFGWKNVMGVLLLYFPVYVLTVLARNIKKKGA